MSDTDGTVNLRQATVVWKALLVAGLMFGLLSPSAQAASQGAHLWLELVPGEYVGAHVDPWIHESWVNFVDFSPGGSFSAQLKVSNEHTAESADTYVLIALPETTTTAMFASLTMSGGVQGPATYVRSDFARTEFNPYSGPSALVGDFVSAVAGYRSGSHGVYPPSGNADWKTYHAGVIPPRDPANPGANVKTLMVVVTLGPSPDLSFKVHFDAYSLAGEALQFWVPPSHDATEAGDSLAPPPFQAFVVDVSGDNQYIAVGGGKTVSFFQTYATPENRLRWQVTLTQPVTAVALSENGQYLAVVAQKLPLSPGAFPELRVYETSGPSLRLQHSLGPSSVLVLTRPLDITRTGSYVVVGTGSWGFPGPRACLSPDPVIGEPEPKLWLFQNPFAPGPWQHWTWERGVPDNPTVLDCITSARFSGSGAYLVAGWFHNQGFDVLDVAPNMPLRATTTGAMQDAVFSVSISHSGTRIGAGQGDLDRVSLWSFIPATNTLTQLWRTSATTTNGNHYRQAISDDGQYVFAQQSQTDLSEISGFHLYDSQIPPDPNDKSPTWRFDVTDGPMGIDLSVVTPRYGVGVHGSNVRLWGNGFAVPPGGPTPSYSALATGLASDVAISYEGPIFAVADTKGFLLVYDASLPGVFFWQYPP